MTDSVPPATRSATRQSRRRPLGRIGRLLRFPWSLLFLIAFIAALLVLLPVTTLSALADADGDWQARLPGGRFWTHATISQVAFAGIPFMGLLALAEVGLIKMLPGEVRLWRSRMAARGPHAAGTKTEGLTRASPTPRPRRITRGRRAR